MTWDAAGKRWAKLYRGRKHRIGCKELGCSPTRSGSREAANEWWRAKKDELDKEHRGKLDASFAPILAQLDTTLASIEAEPPGPIDNRAYLYRMFRAMRAALVDANVAGREIPPTDRPPLRLTIKPFADEPWTEPAAPSGDAIEEYLKLRRRAVDNGDLSPGRYSPEAIQLGHFKKWLQDQRRNVESIDGALWESWGFHVRELVGNGTSAAYARDRLSASKTLLRWATATGRLASLPLNFNTVRPKTVRAAAVETIPLGELRAIIEEAPPRLQCWLWLMLNTGAQQQDLADLLASDFDAKAGTLTRKRSKTRRHENVPTVTYKLWPETRTLLRKFKAESGDLLLTNEDGRPLVSSAIVDGKLRKSDAVKSAYYRLGVKLKRELPALKYIRKSGSSFIDDIDRKETAQWYLGHAGGPTVADKHYLTIQNERLAAALDKLRNRLLPTKS